MRKFTLSALVVSILAGCASPQYSCPLPDGGTRCAGMNDSYSAATRSKGASGQGHESVLNDLVHERDSRDFLGDAEPQSGGVSGVLNRLLGRADREASPPAAYGGARSQNEPPSGAAARGGYPMPPDQGMPVYTPPQVHRAWTGPWVDNSGQTMHGGEYQYYTTPGQWNYGTLATPGSGADVSDFAPVSPDRIIKAKSNGKRSKPKSNMAGVMSSNIAETPPADAKK